MPSPPPLYELLKVSGFEEMQEAFNREARPLLAARRDSSEDAQKLANLLDVATDHVLRIGYPKVYRRWEDSREDTKQEIIVRFLADKECEEDPYKVLNRAKNTVVTVQKARGVRGRRRTATDYDAPETGQSIVDGVEARSDWTLRIQKELYLTKQEKALVDEAIERAYPVDKKHPRAQEMRALMRKYYLEDYEYDPAEQGISGLESNRLYKGRNAVRSILQAAHPGMYDELADKLAWREYSKKSTRHQESDANGYNNGIAI